MTNISLYKQIVLKVWMIVTKETLRLGFGTPWLQGQIETILSSLMRNRYEK